ncbi:MAG TPA: hypothetical protein VGJ32_11160 [Solirubrobacteraceae bacterium]
MKLAAVTFVIAALAVPARADKGKPYTSVTLGFTASFPYEVQEQTAPDGSGTAAGIDPSGIMYMVGMLPVPDEAAKKPIKDQLDDGLAGMVEKVHGKVASQKDIKLGGSPGREAEIDLEGGHATFRVYIVERKGYLIGVVHKDGTTLPMKPADFFSSFKLTKKK